MFGLKKKSIVVNVVNTKELEPGEVFNEENTDPNFGAQVYVLMNNAMYAGVVLMATYFLGDTIRHCVIHTVAVRIQPPVIVEAVAEAASKK